MKEFTTSEVAYMLRPITKNKKRPPCSELFSFAEKTGVKKQNRRSVPGGKPTYYWSENDVLNLCSHYKLSGQPNFNVPTQSKGNESTRGI